VNAPPEGEKKAPMSGDTLKGAQTLAVVNTARIEKGGLTVKPWRWGWPQWVSWLYVNGKGVRR